MAYYRGIGSAGSSSWVAAQPETIPPPSLLPQSGRPWSRTEDKVFESALVAYPEHIENRWDFVAAQLPGRTAQEVLEHYEALVADVDLIERGMVETPDSWDDDKSARATSGRRRRGVPRSPSVPWSDEEHKLFLEGLSKYKRGDWRNISRMVVKTRTPTQVASHAQKHFLRQAKAVSTDDGKSTTTQDTTAA